MTIAPTSETTNRRYHRRRHPFGDHVAAAVGILQRQCMDRVPSAIATMARLRSAIGKSAGADYDLLAVTAVPDALLGFHPTDLPTDTERAKHTALALYGLHQQSIYDVPMHLNGIALGNAVHRLAMTSQSADAVRRRFAALGTASTFDESVRHARGLIYQLRDARIGLDYGLLADDLVRLLPPGGHTSVAALWGRDYYRYQPETADMKDTDAKITETEPS